MIKLDVFIGWVWCFCSFGTVAYVVFWLGHSGWWFALPMVLLPSSDKKCKCDQPTNEVTK